MGAARSPKMKGHFLKVVWPNDKHSKPLLQCMQQKINNGISKAAAANFIAPDWPVTSTDGPLARAKSATPCDVASSKFLDYLLLLSPKADTISPSHGRQKAASTCICTKSTLHRSWYILFTCALFWSTVRAAWARWFRPVYRRSIWANALAAAFCKT